jgi:hypothetical protein
VELLNDEGEVIATTRTDRHGRYSFNQFGETGDFQVHVVVPARMTATTENPKDILIATGDVTVTGIDFGLKSLGGFGS